jgi:diguanylate cyclase (GGDEF)-like protein
VFALFLLVATAYAPAAVADVPLDPASGVANLLPGIDVLRDPTGRWTLADVLRNAAAFRPDSTLVPDPHFSAFLPDTLWFRVRPRTSATGPWFLTTSFEVDRSRLFYVPDHGAVRQIDFGMLVPYAERATPFLTNAVPLPAGATSGGTLYLQTVMREDLFGTIGLRPLRWEALDGRAHDEDDIMPELVVCGIVGALGLFNLLLGFTLRESIYVRYAAAMGCFALYECVECGAAWRWIWPHASLPYDVTAYAIYLVYLALVLGFACAFLDLRNTQRPAWNVILATYAVVVAVEMTMALWPNLLDRTGYSGPIETLANALLLIAILGSGLVAWRRGFAGAGPYVLAFAGVTVGLVIGTGADDQLLPENLWTDALPGLGVAWEAFFLALAVSKRIERLRGERDSLATAAFTDSLTGIPNRRAFELRFQDEWRLAIRDGTALSIVLIDVDFFKAYNDEHGHLAGDGALERVALTIAESVRGHDDVVARYGGEEFIVLLPRCDERGAERVAEAVRIAIERLSITVSAGVASAVPGRAGAPEALIATADRAMYRAKRDGRNRVVVSSEAVA